MFYNYEIKFVDGYIKVTDLFSSKKNSCCGASVYFLGNVRISSMFTQHIESIEYIIIEQLAVNIIRKVFFLIFKKYGKFIFLQIIMSKGIINLGEISIFIKVCTPHRKDAFRLCYFILEVIKKNIPVWKREKTFSTEQWLLPA